MRSLRVLIILLVFIILSAPLVIADSFKYDAKAKRDPFVPLIGVERPKVSGLEGVASIEDVRLEGILTGAKGKMSAVINGEIVKVNDVVGEVTVKEISTRNMVITISGKDYTVSLPDERGAKGE